MASSPPLDGDDRGFLAGGLDDTSDVSETCVSPIVGFSAVVSVGDADSIVSTSEVDNGVSVVLV